MSGSQRLSQSFKIGRTGFTKTDKNKMSTHLISAFVFATQFVKSLLIKKKLKPCFVLEHEQCVQFVPRKRHFSLWKVGIFYLEIFPNKMSVYIRLRCRNQSTIRREISNRLSNIRYDIYIYIFYETIRYFIYAKRFFSVCDITGFDRRKQRRHHF